MCFYLPERYKEEAVIHSPEKTVKNQENRGSKNKQIIAVVVFIIYILGIIFEPQTKISAPLIGIVCVVVLGIAGVLNEKQIYRSIDWSTVFFIVGMLTLADALVKSGASKVIANGAVALMGKSPSGYVLTAALFLLSALLTQFMSNTATAGMLYPIGIAIARGIGADPSSVVMAIAIGCSCAFATPIGTPANTMVMIPGKYKFTDWVKVGAPLIIIALLVSLVILPVVWPFFK